MTLRKLIGALSILVLGLAISPAARAGESDQLTKMTFDQAIEVPGHILPAGTYWFKVMGNTNDPQKNIIKIYDEDNQHLVAMVQAIAMQRKSGYSGPRVPDMDRTELRIASGSSVHPAALLTWFYPFGYSGHQFYYPHNDRQRLEEEPVIIVHLDNNSNAHFTGLLASNQR